MGKIIVGRAGVPGVKGKFQHLHAREAALPHQLPYRVRHIAQVLRNYLVPAQDFLHPAEQLQTGSLLPMAMCRVRGTVGHGVVFVEAPEMVDAGHVVEPEAVPEPGEPPPVARLLVILPTVQRIPPELARCRKTVGRAAGYRGGLLPFVKLEQLRMRPDVRAVHGRVYGYVPDDLYPLLVCVRFQLAPLTEEFILHILLELNVIVQLPAAEVQRVFLAQTDLLRPFRPRRTSKTVLDSHEQRVILQPPAVFLHKRLIARVLCNPAVFVRLP